MLESCDLRFATCKIHMRETNIAFILCSAVLIKAHILMSSKATRMQIVQNMGCFVLSFALILVFPCTKLNLITVDQVEANIIQLWRKIRQFQKGSRKICQAFLSPNHIKCHVIPPIIVGVIYPNTCYFSWNFSLFIVWTNFVAVLEGNGLFRIMRAWQKQWSEVGEV